MERCLVHVKPGLADMKQPVRFSMTQPDERESEFRITRDHLKRLMKSGDRHKYDYGHAVVVSGPPGQSGAARLAARGALRVGAGLVSVFCLDACKGENAARLDAIMVKAYPDDDGFADGLSTLRASAVCIGPNLGLDWESHGKLLDILSLGIPLCLDADAITLIAQDPEPIKAVMHPQVVMTPHEGELRRLIPDVFARTTCRVSLAVSAAQTMKCTVLFKGTDTIVAQPNGDHSVVSSQGFAHAAWLATAGSGDVLSGIITGLIAKGFDVSDAASLGANLHLRCAEKFGPGLIAEDLPEALPAVLRQCFETEDHVK
ncbi:YjeF C-terminal domain family protein [Roseobacter sp. GAI101]|nr:YjeF C-terminal domain family protein [Roseobacter sp. GAI101]